MMKNKKIYQTYVYDPNILQSKTVENIIRALTRGLDNDNLSSVANYLIAIRRKAMSYGISRKCASKRNTVDKRIAKINLLNKKKGV